MPRPAARPRKATPLSESLHRQLSLYVLAAAGVSALTQPSEAEVVYTPINHKIATNETFAIDLNHDGLTDFTIENLLHHFNMQLKVSPTFGGYEVIGQFVSWAEALRPGSMIGVNRPSGRPDRSRSGIMASVGSYLGYSNGSWFNVSDRYLGLAFKIHGKLHYGWARLSTNWNHNLKIEATLTGFAYETEPDIPIIAGDTGGLGKNGADASPRSEKLSVPSSSQPPVTLGALALGGNGLSAWRLEKSQ
jgi:hypothetical protein